MRFFCFIVVVVVVFQGWAANAALPSVSEYKEQLGGVVEELNRHEEWIGTANEQVLTLEAQIKESDTEIAEVAKEITVLESNIGRLEERIGVLEGDRESNQSKITTLTDSVNWHLQSEYRLQKNHWLKSLLDYDEPKTRARFIRYHRFFVSSKSKLLEEFNSVMVNLSQTTQELHLERSRLNHERDLASKSNERLNEQVAQREVQIASLESEFTILKLWWKS